MHKWNVFEDFDEAAKQAALFLAKTIKNIIDINNVCHVILPGGNTPIKTLQFLTQQGINWNKVHWYLGDERCCAIGDSDRNDVMLQKELWSKLGNTHIHRMQTEYGAEKAAELYREEIKSLEVFDIALLGMGEDGHTASLFPGHKALNDQRSVIPVYDSPKPPPERVSLSITTLKKTKVKIVLAQGEGKAKVIADIKAGELLPVNMIGDIHWYLDQAAYKNNE